jgi:hypothetical protein
MAVQQLQVAYHLAQEIAATILQRKSGDPEKLRHCADILGPVSFDDAHILGLDRVGGGTRRHCGLADRAHRHVEEIRQHVMALTVVGKALKRLDELLPVFCKRRHTWSFLPAGGALVLFL